MNRSPGQSRQSNVFPRKFRAEQFGFVRWLSSGSPESHPVLFINQSSRCGASRTCWSALKCLEQQLWTSLCSRKHAGVTHSSTCSMDHRFRFVFTVIPSCVFVRRTFSRPSAGVYKTDAPRGSHDFRPGKTSLTCKSLVDMRAG